MADFAEMTPDERDQWFADEARRYREQAADVVLDDEAPLDKPESVRREFDARVHVEEPGHRGNVSEPLTVIRPEELIGAEIPDREWVVPSLVPCGAVTGLYGDGGLGKSNLALQLQAACAIGGEWCGRIVEPVKSIGFYCEDDTSEIMRRWRRMENFYCDEISSSKQARFVSRIGMDNALATFTRAGKLELTRFHRQVVEFIQDERARLFIWDTVSDGFVGNENDRTQVRGFVQVALGSIALQTNGAVVALAHPSRAGLADGSGQSGSTAWNGAFRQRLYFSHEKTDGDVQPDDDVRILSVKKANYAPKAEEIRLRYDKGIFRIDTPAGNGYRPPAEDVFLNLVDALTAEARPISASKNAGNFAPKVFAKRRQRQGYNRADFERAMESLFAKKAIRQEQYGRRSDERFKLVRA